MIRKGIFLQGEEEVVAVMLQTGGDEEQRDADEGSCSGRIGELEVGKG